MMEIYESDYDDEKVLSSEEESSEDLLKFRKSRKKRPRRCSNNSLKDEVSHIPIGNGEKCIRSNTGQ